jgi:hypothetical protein
MHAVDDTPERLEAVARANGIDPGQHCCLTMSARIGLANRVPSTLPVVVWVSTWNEYLVPVAGGESVDSVGSEWSRGPVGFCPWCGDALPASLRSEWFDRLHKLGYDDPAEQDVPDEFKSDAWWRT